MAGSDNDSPRWGHIPAWEFEMIHDVAQLWEIKPTEAENILADIGAFETGDDRE